MSFVPWNQEGWKTGVCSVPPVGHTHSLLTLANNTCVRTSFTELRERFTRLYRKKVTLARTHTHTKKEIKLIINVNNKLCACVFQAHLHHYVGVDGMEVSGFSEALHSLSDLIEQYDTLASSSEKKLTHNAPRLSIAT